jgi:hypothetical protein
MGSKRDWFELSQMFALGKEEKTKKKRDVIVAVSGFLISLC